jgi:hypothetical protein
MMELNWKVLTPLSLVVIMVIALVDRLFVGAADWQRTIILLVANLVILVVAERLIRRGVKTTGPEVGSRERPIASPDNLFIQPGSGAKG